MTPDKLANRVGDSAAPTEPAALARRLVSRRALVRAGWVLPLVMGLELLPGKAFASPGAGACVRWELQWDETLQTWVEVCVEYG
jgi:hypothetical protein